MHLVTVVIPIYKPIPDENELISFNQCLTVLYKHPICILTYKLLDISYYENILNDAAVYYQIVFFDKSFFESVDGYNRLLLSLDFYKRFSHYKYILIYQLDTFVFRDGLDYWCSKEYDYIGAPWFNEHKSYEEGASLWMVGNGGFSLRKISTFLDILTSKKNAYSLKRLYKEGKKDSISWLSLLRKFITGYENNINYLIQNWNDAEDVFFCLVLKDTYFKLKIPTPVDAVPFAFECSPKYLFELNNKKLPFGCHAWYRYDYDNFWSKYISS